MKKFTIHIVVHCKNVGFDPKQVEKEGMQWTMKIEKKWTVMSQYNEVVHCQCKHVQPSRYPQPKKELPNSFKSMFCLTGQA